MASLVDFYKQKLVPVGQRLSSFIDRDKSMEGTQLMRGGLGNNAKSFGKQFVQAASQTAPTVAQDFGNMFRNTFKNVPLLSTAGNIVGDTAQRIGSSTVDVVQGAYRTLQRPDWLGKLQGATQTVRGVGKALVAVNPHTPIVDIAANTGKEDSLRRRVATGYSRGISQIPELAPNTVAKNISIGDKENPLISFDPAMSAANMVGFVKNPINAKLFKATTALIPSADKSLKLWLTTTAARGSLENILLGLPDMPDQMTTGQKAQWLATNAGIGAVQEIAGQGIVKGLGKVGSAISESKAGKAATEAAAKQFDKLVEFKRKWDIPYKKMGTGRLVGQEITAPMWKWKLGLVDDGAMRTFDSTIDTPKLSVEPTGGKETVANAENELRKFAFELDRQKEIVKAGNHQEGSPEYNKFLSMVEKQMELSRKVREAQISIVKDKAKNFNNKNEFIDSVIPKGKHVSQGSRPLVNQISRDRRMLSNLYDEVKAKPLSVEPVGGITDNANQFLSSVRAKFPDNNEKEMFDYAKKIADIRGSKQVDVQDIAEAVQYSRKVKGLGEDVGFNSLFSKDRAGTEILDRMKEVGVKNIDTSIYNVRDQVKNKLISLDKDTQSFVEAIARREGLVDVDGRISKRGLEILNNIIPGGKPTIQDIAKKMDTYKKVLSPSPLGGKDLLSEARKYKSAEEFVRDAKLLSSKRTTEVEMLNAQKEMLDFAKSKGHNSLVDIPENITKDPIFIKAQNKFNIANKKDKDFLSSFIGKNLIDLKTKASRNFGYVGSQKIRNGNFDDAQLIDIYKQAQSSPLGGKVEPKTVTPIRKPLKEVYLEKLNQPAELSKVSESLTKPTELSKVDPTIQATQRSLQEPSQSLPLQDQLKPLTRVTPISSKNVASPDILPSTVKSRGLTESVQQAQNIVPEVKSGVTGTYAPKPNAQLMAEAQTLLNEGGTVDLSKVKNADQKVAATIQEAINAQQAGDHQLAANLFNNLSEQGTELGRGVQAFSLLEKMSPEAVSLSAAGQIKKYNSTHSAKIPELTGDQTKLIADKVSSIRSMPDGREKNIALNELSQTINSFIPSSFADKAITVWKAGLLTSLRTHIRNQIGNSVHTGMEIIKDVVATPIDAMLSGATGQRTKTLTIKGLGEFGSQSTRQQMMDIMSKGFDPSEQINKFDHRSVNWGNTTVEKALKAYTDLVFRSLGAADKPYYNATLARSLYDQAGAAAINSGKKGDLSFINELVKNPTEGMMKIAINDANIATFKNKNSYSKIANAIKQSAVSSGQEYGGDVGREVAKIATEFIAPFTGVPSSVVGQITAYSPIGLIKGIVNVGKVIATQIPDLQRQASEEIGRGGVGTAIMALGAYLASKGLVTGQPKDAAEQRQWDLENKPRNSIFIGGKWRSLNSIGPEALVLLAGAKADEELNNPEGSLSNYAGTLIKDQLDQSFVQGIQGPVNAITDPQRYAKSYTGNAISSFVPNIVKDISKSIDPYARETNTTGDYVKASIPGLRNTLVNKRDTLGRVINQEPTGVSAFVDVFNSKTPVSNPVVQEFSRLNDSGFNVAPGKIGKAQTINGQKVSLSPKELDQFEQKVGQVAMPSLQQLISSPSYQSLDDESKSKKIDSLMTKIRAQVRNGNLETVTPTVKKIVTKKVKKVSSKRPKTVKKISAPKLSKFNLASKVRKVKRIRTKQYKLQIPK